MSTSNTRFLVSKCHSSLKGARDAWRNGPIPGLGVKGGGQDQGDLGSTSTRKQGRDISKVLPKGHGSG